MDDDTWAAGQLAENMLRHNHTQQLPHTIRMLQLACEQIQYEIGIALLVSVLYKQQIKIRK